MLPQNPNVRYARVWEWSSFWSLLLVLVEAVLVWLQAIEQPSMLVTVLVASLPAIVRWLRQKVTGAASSFRRAEPPPAE